MRGSLYFDLCYDPLSRKSYIRKQERGPLGFAKMINRNQYTTNNEVLVQNRETVEKKLIADIEEDIRKGYFIDYSTVGSRSLGKHNCITWAAEKLEKAFNVKITINSLIAIPSQARIVALNEEEKTQTCSFM